MFFIISGILFSKVYINRILNKQYTFNRFIGSRYQRIFPLVIVSSIIMYFLHLIYFNKFGYFFSGGNLKIIDLLFDLTIGGTVTLGSTVGSVNSPIWYIGVLFLCYIIAYFLTLVYKNKKSFLVFAIPIFVGVFILKTNFNLFIFNFYVARGLCAFFIGVLIGNNKVLEYISSLPDNTKYLFRILTLTLLIILLAIAVYGDSSLFIGGYVDITLFYSFIFFPLLILSFYGVKLINDIGNTKLFRFLGNISFGIYIWNYPIMIIEVFLIKSNILNVNVCEWKFFILNFLAHIICATISYILIENKLSNLISQKLNKNEIK